MDGGLGVLRITNGEGWMAGCDLGMEMVSAWDGMGWMEPGAAHNGFCYDML